MKKVLVLGGNGFIGRNLCNYIATKNYDVYSFDMFIPNERIEGIHYIEGDFFDDTTLKDIIADKDVIYHAISTLNPGNSNKKYMMGYERDFIQTVKLCELMVGVDRKMIFLSSGGTVYGNQKIQPIKETALPHPINHYGNLKLCIENTIETFNYQSGTNILIARISNPYGPGQDYRKGVGFIDAALKKAILGEPIEIWGDGNIIRDYIYIDDVCQMLMSLIDYKGEHQIFNLSSNIGATLNEILDIMRKNIKGMNIRYLDERPVDAKKIILDNSRIMELNQYQLVELEAGINKYYRYICDQIEKEI